MVLGQRIVARLRERTYQAAIRQEVEFVERGEGDVISRLSVDSSIVGERYDCHHHLHSSFCACMSSKRDVLIILWFLPA